MALSPPNTTFTVCLGPSHKSILSTMRHARARVTPVGILWLEIGKELSVMSQRGGLEPELRRGRVAVPTEPEGYEVA